MDNSGEFCMELLVGKCNSKVKEIIKSKRFLNKIKKASFEKLDKKFEIDLYVSLENIIKENECQLEKEELEKLNNYTSK